MHRLARVFRAVFAMNMHHCPSCNEQVSPNAKFCVRCEAKLDDGSREAEIASNQDKNVCSASRARAYDNRRTSRSSPW